MATSANGVTFGYDANGNATTRGGSAITWYSSNLPKLMTASGSNSSEFFYGPDRARWKQVASYAGTSEETVYIGGLVEKVTRGGVTSWRHYISGAGGTVAEYIRRSSGTNQTVYLLKDHLGSVEMLTDASDATIARLAYGGQGPRRNGTTWGGTPSATETTAITNTTRRGYTGHEMLDNLGLIHMNGRVYDSNLGRFPSADPIIQSPGNTQSFNRYSYVWNNPNKFTDPSGYRLNRRSRHVNRDRGESDSREISTAAELGFYASNRGFGLAFGNGSINGLPAMQRMTGAQWASRALLNGFRGVNGPVSAGTFVGQMRWVRGGTVGVGQVGENGEAVDATPGRVAGHWEMGSAVGETPNPLVNGPKSSWSPLNLFGISTANAAENSRRGLIHWETDSSNPFAASPIFTRRFSGTSEELAFRQRL